MDMDAYKVKEIIGDNPRFLSPFCEPCSYYIWKKGDEMLAARIAQYCLTYIERFVRQAFHPVFYEFYGVKQNRIRSPDQMCQELMVDSFVLDADTETIGCCLSNSQFLFGHYIDCLWNDNWELVYSYIC